MNELQTDLNTCKILMSNPFKNSKLILIKNLKKYPVKLPEREEFRSYLPYIDFQ